MLAADRNASTTTGDGGPKLRLNLADKVLALQDSLDSRNEIRCRVHFGYKRMGTGRQRGARYSFRVVLTQKYYSCFWRNFTDANSSLNPSESGHAYIQYDHVGLENLGLTYALYAISGFAYDFKARLSFQERTHLLTKNCVIVNHENPQRLWVVWFGQGITH